MKRCLVLVPLVLLFLVSCSGGIGAPKAPMVQRGVLDLRFWNPKTSGPVSLSGDWDFFPGRLLHSAEAGGLGAPSRRSVPDKWYDREAGGENGQGAATYRVRVLLPVGNRDLGIWYKSVSTSFELEVSGQVLASAGRPALGPELTVADYHSGVCALPATPADGVDLLVRVANYEYRTGGMWESFVIGPQTLLADQKRLSEVLTFVIFGFITSLAVYSLVIFLFRREFTFYLSFALFILAVGVRTLVTGEYALVSAFPDLDLQTVVRLEYLTVYLIVGLGSLYLSNLFPHEIGRWKRTVLVGLGALGAGLSLVLPLPVLTSLAAFNYAYSLAAIGLFSLDIVRSVIHKRADSGTMGLGVLILGAGAVADIVKNSFFPASHDILPYALGIFACTQAVILARRFSHGISEADRLALEKSELEKRTEEQRVLAVLKERELLAHEIHDSIGQKLGFLNMSVQTLQELLHMSKVEELDAGLQRIAQVAAETHVDIRDFLQDVRSTQILSKGFLATLREYLVIYQGESSVQVDLRVEGGFDEQAWNSSQKVQAFKVIQEGLSNIRKHSGTRSAVLTLSRPGFAIRLCLEDQGRGFLVDSVSPQNHFGIHIMKERAQIAHGTLTIESAPGAGTRLILEFPRELDGNSLHGSQVLVPENPHRERIRLMVVDDHELFRSGLCNLLNVGGYPLVGVASRGDQAVDMALKLRPNVVLMDNQLPGLPGLQAARTIRQRDPAIRIILLTAYAEVSLLHESFQAGISGFFLKTVQPRELFLAIDRVAAGENLLTPDSVDEISRATQLAGAILGQDGALNALTARQKEVLQWAAAGLTYKEIGARLHISERTVKFHMGEIVDKLQVTDRKEAEAFLKRLTKSS